MRKLSKKASMARAKFPCIVAWGNMMQSFDYYINSQCCQAEADHAPRNATFFSDQRWHTSSEIGDPILRQRIEQGL